MNKNIFRKYIKYVLIFLIILAFAALYFFVFKRNVVSYPKSSWLNSIFPTLSFSDESKNISSDFFSYNLPLEKFPNNYDEIVNGILKKDLEYKEKVLLIRNGNLILDNSSNSFSDQIESIENSKIPLFLGSNLVLNDFLIQINEIETLMKKEFEMEFVDELKVSLSSSEDLYNQVKEEKSKEIIVKNIKQLYSSIFIFY